MGGQRDALGRAERAVQRRRKRIGHASGVDRWCRAISYSRQMRTDGESEQTKRARDTRAGTHCTGSAVRSRSARRLSGRSQWSSRCRPHLAKQMQPASQQGITDSQTRQCSVDSRAASGYRATRRTEANRPLEQPFFDRASHHCPPIGPNIDIVHTHPDHAQTGSKSETSARIEQCMGKEVWMRKGR